jgi:hypothetical protein
MASKNITTSFYDLTGTRLSITSFLNMFNIMEDDDKIKFMNIFRSYVVNSDILTDIMFYDVYEVEPDDWWELISYVLYESVNLWWINCLMNNVNNPFEEMEPGAGIKLLKDSYVPQLVREIRDISEL